MNIVLDLDGTLTNTAYSLDQLIARPYLDRFLLFCFQNFASVSIWASSNEYRCSHIYYTILEPILRSISIILNKPCTFAKIMWDSHCNIYQNKLIKPLVKYYSRNTVIVDDTPSKSMCNPSNAILIPTFDSFVPFNQTSTQTIYQTPNQTPNDMMLLYLEQYLYDWVESFIYNSLPPINSLWYKDISRANRAYLIAEQYVQLPDFMDTSD